MKTSHPLPLKWSMTRTLIIGWLLPLVLIACTLLYLVSHTISGQIRRTIGISTEKAVEICELQLSETLAASKMASYNPVIRDSYNQYRRNHSKGAFVTAVTSFLNQQYKYDRNFLSTVVFLLEEPDVFCFTYNTYQDNNVGAEGYSRIEYFKENHLEDMRAQASRRETRTELRMENGHCYMVRNLVDASFCPYAVLVIELSPKFVFESLNSVWGALDYEVYLDGEAVFGNGTAEALDILPEALGVHSAEAIEREKNGGTWVETLTKPENGYEHRAGRAFSYRKFAFEDQELVCLVKLDSKMLVDDMRMIYWMLGLVVLFVIPLVYMIFRFFHTKVTKPVAELVSASREIANGNYGHQIQETGSSMEFEYLDGAFNAMSVELKHQFEKIYLEELALKDASIKALQSQINPHFLNNTLEIINWEARMNGNEKISGMIEALATMLNATMNRRHRRYITLAEELEYVDAYLYIIKQRLGERFTVERWIEPSLLDVKVPLLIIQPIVENAVEHGMQGRKTGKVSIHIFEKDEKMYIEVINDGGLSEEDRKRIDYLLGEDCREDEEHHVSLGIRNVDRRLRIIYGEEYGLSIKTDKENYTKSTILVKIDKDNKKSQ